jgi:hypothetical protein
VTELLHFTRDGEAYDVFPPENKKNSKNGL